jgi:hypothetical protein
MIINVVSCTLKQDKGNGFKIFTVEDNEGKKYDAFAEFTVGEHEVEITPNSPYNDKIKKAASAKPKFTPQVKDYGFERKKLAIEAAVQIRKENGTDDVLSSATKILNWLNN